MLGPIDPQKMTPVSILLPLQAVAREWFGNGVPPPVEGRGEAYLSLGTNVFLTRIIVTLLSSSLFTMNILQAGICARHRNEYNPQVRRLYNSWKNHRIFDILLSYD